MLDDALVRSVVISWTINVTSLNPCCAGRCPSTQLVLIVSLFRLLSLNPCCAGRCPSTRPRKVKTLICEVSILVVLDDALVRSVQVFLQKMWRVSILVVLDDALVHYQALSDYVIKHKSQSLLCWTMP